MDIPVTDHSASSPVSPLRAARCKHGITQQELADLAGVSQSFISNLEAGLSALDYRVLGAVSKLGEDTKPLKRRHRKYVAAMARLARRQTAAPALAPCDSKPKKTDAG